MDDEFREIGAFKIGNMRIIRGMHNNQGCAGTSLIWLLGIEYN